MPRRRCGKRRWNGMITWIRVSPDHGSDISRRPLGQTEKSVLMRSQLLSSLVVLGLVAGGCASSTSDGDEATAPLTEDATSCNNGALPAADRTRKVVVS